MDTTIIAAIIGGCFAVIAAVVPLIKRKRIISKRTEIFESNLILKYDINEDPNLEQWGDYYVSPIRTIEKINEDGLGFKLSVFSPNHIGVNMGIYFLKGRVEFDYQVLETNATKDNILVFIIPMQRSNAKNDLIEVGTDKQSDPLNGFSPFRQRVLLHHNSKKWRTIKIDFDFTALETASYGIFAPRINEGCPRPSKGSFKFRNVKIYKSEPRRMVHRFP